MKSYVLMKSEHCEISAEWCGNVDEHRKAAINQGFYYKQMYYEDQLKTRLGIWTIKKNIKQPIEISTFASNGSKTSIDYVDSQNTSRNVVQNSNFERIGLLGKINQPETVWFLPLNNRVNRGYFPIIQFQNTFQQTSWNANSMDLDAENNDQQKTWNTKWCSVCIIKKWSKYQTSG